MSNHFIAILLFVMSFLRSQIPNLFTLGNLICGSLAILHILQDGVISPWVLLIGLAGVLDVFDGAVARALGVSGPLGKELDSLADVISFGLAPTFIIYTLLSQNLPEPVSYLKYIAFLNVAMAAMRLANFNIATDQSKDFSGMPSPANGIFWGSVAMVLYEWAKHFAVTREVIWKLDQGAFVAIVIALTIFTSLIMVLPIRMFSFKFQPGGFSANRIPFIYIATMLLFPLFTWFVLHSFFLAVPLGILWYITLSLFYKPVRA